MYGANVFEVIDLINRDYPRGGIAMPGLTAGTCLRKDFAFSEERSHAPGMLLAVSRVNEGVPLFLVEGVKRRIGSLNGRKIAVLGLTFKRDTDDERDSLSPKLIRMLERELADVAVCDPHAATPTQSLEEAVRDADVVIVATNHSEFSGPTTLAAHPRARLRGLPAGRSLEQSRDLAGVRLRRRDARAPGRLHRRQPLSSRGPRAGHRRCRHDRQGGGAPPAARPGVGDPHLRPPRAPGVDARGLRAAPRRPAPARGGPGGAGRLQPRDPSRRHRRRDRQLPQAPVHPHRGQQCPDRRHRARGRRPPGVQRFTYVSSSMVFERATEFPTTEGHLEHLPAAPLGLRVLKARPARSTPVPPTISTACATRSAGPSTPTAPVRSPTPTNPASPTPSPT